MSEEIIEPDVIKNRKKCQRLFKKKIINSVGFNCIFLILMAIITLVINVSFCKLEIYDFKNYIKFVQMILCIISIVLFEIAYKKDTMKIGFFGIEFVIFSCMVLFVPYRYILKNDTNFLKISLIGFTVYYFGKIIISAINIRHSYLKENLSDVKEIVKDEKKGYIDEESKKTLRERKLAEEKSKEPKTFKAKKKPKKQKKNKKI